MSHGMIKYYTFLDEFGTKLKPSSCLKLATELISSFEKESIIRFFSSIAIKYGPANSILNSLKVQEEYFNLPKNTNIILVHRQATLTIFQIIYSIGTKEFGVKTEIPKRTIYLLYLLVNEFLQNIEMKGSNQSTGESLFFSNIKSIQYTHNEDDIKAGFYLYREYYKKMVSLNKSKYDAIIKKAIGFSIDDYIKVIDSVEQRNYPQIFSLFEKYAVIPFDNIEKEWSNRKPRLEIPFNIPFMQNYPLIKKGSDYLLSDIYNLINSVCKNLYEILLEDDRAEFKSNFGKEIVEPVIQDLLEKTFIDDKCKVLKVKTNKYEYADYGILYDNCVYLFEIKSTVINYSTLYETEISKFLHHFDNKFIESKGVKQQFEKLKKLDTDYKSFCSLSNLNSSIKYKVYPILVCFDEVLQSFCCNWYISEKFRKMSTNLNLQNIKLAACHSTITLNEVFRMQYIDKNPSQKLELLKLYSDTENKKPYSFGFFLQELNVLQRISEKVHINKWVSKLFLEVKNKFKNIIHLRS